MKTLPLFDYYFCCFLEDYVKDNKDNNKLLLLIKEINKKKINNFYDKNGKEINNYDEIFKEAYKIYLSKKSRKINYSKQLFIKDNNNCLIPLQKPILHNNSKYKAFVKKFKNLKNNSTELIILNKCTENFLLNNKINNIKYIDYLPSSIISSTLIIENNNFNNLPNKIEMLNLTNKHFDEGTPIISNLNRLKKIKKLPKKLILILKSQDNITRNKIQVYENDYFKKIINNYKIFEIAKKISKLIKCVFLFENDYYNFDNITSLNKQYWTITEKKTCFIDGIDYKIKNKK